MLSTCLLDILFKLQGEIHNPSILGVKVLENSLPVIKYSRALIATIQNNKTEGIFMFILLRLFENQIENRNK